MPPVLSAPSTVTYCTSAPKETVIRTKGGSCGGIIGVMALNVDETSRFQLVLNQCKVLGNDALNRVRIENEGNTAGIPGNTNNVNQERNARGRSGALIGHVGKRYDGISASNTVIFSISQGLRIIPTTAAARSTA